MLWTGSPPARACHRCGGLLRRPMIRRGAHPWPALADLSNRTIDCRRNSSPQIEINSLRTALGEYQDVVSASAMSAGCIRLFVTHSAICRPVSIGHRPRSPACASSLHAPPCSQRDGPEERRMRAHTLISILVAGGAVAVAGWGLAAPKPGAVLADKSPSALQVDVELVIAVDVSNSMDPEEQALQREGYILGLTSREFLQALRNGNHGRIAITYFEWAGLYDQKIILPWRLIDGPESAESVTNEIKRTPYRRAPRTSIFGALQFAKPLFDSSGYGGLRRVIDVSGDGSNNMGPPVTIMRDEVLAAGITINGLPIMLTWATP